MHYKKLLGMLILTASFSLTAACGRSNSAENPLSPAPAQIGQSADSSDAGASTDTESNNTDTSNEQEVSQNMSETQTPESFKLTSGYKNYDQVNPIQTNRFGADPYAIEYDGRAYFYSTADAFEKNASGEIAENTYSSIKSIYVSSTDDMVNFTDHGTIRAAGPAGAAKWARNSWAPAACWKMIDGKPKFFLYFADNGGGIGVLTADSPVGPFTDPLGEALVSRKTPNCANVEWLFDPAVLIDDDGIGYLYFGGGVPQGKFAAPGTGRVVRLGADMISLDCEPVAIDIPYLFEDSGIHKFNNKYYYTYCTNFNVDEEGTSKYGFQSGEIAMLVSDSPMGPFTYQERILRHPATLVGLGGNNHHCVFKFNGDWYITYHARSLEKRMGVEKGYRSTHVEKFSIAEDGTIGSIPMSFTDRPATKSVDPYTDNLAVNVAVMGGTIALPADEVSKSCGSGNMYLAGFDRGDYIEIQNVDFKDGLAALKSASVTYINNSGKAGRIEFTLDNPFAEPIAYVDVPAETVTEFKVLEGVANEKGLAAAKNGTHNLFVVCRDGEDLGLSTWKIK